jgi:hypothetical protein
LCRQSIHFEFIGSGFVFCLSVHFHFSSRFTFSFLSVSLSVFVVFFAVSLLRVFQYRVFVPASFGAAGITHVSPLNFMLRWPHASRLSSCGLSIYRSLFSSFSFPFPSIPLLLLLTSGNRTAKLVPIPFCSRDLPESYLLLFFSPNPLPSSLWCPTFGDPAGNCRQHLSCVTRGLTDTLPLQHLDFPIGDVQRKQTGAMFDHLSFSAQV